MNWLTNEITREIRKIEQLLRRIEPLPMGWKFKELTTSPDICMVNLNFEQKFKMTLQKRDKRIPTP